MSDREPGQGATFELNPEEAALVAVQAKLADRPGVLPAARGLSHFGEHSLGWMGLAALGALLSKDRRRQYVTAGVGAFVAHAASVVIKRIVRRRRPDHPAIAVGVGTPSKLSFPSSHATSSTAGSILLGRASGVPGGALLLPAAVVPPMLTSRMVLGVHYPTDVAAGAAIGAATALAAIEGERLWTRREARKAGKNMTKGSDN
ncbi:Phosphoesterase PA-phosphatase related protein OS=Tsukamurella paurometabola (strain ATCC 8368 / DSM / CCUG 35730 / CIP 100753 / JCM 10117 / KCTC 9821 /NBRC 16120 / NCIMB 702349 / NCTC 13040) OX=521096 GN=Tpau_0163 PE=4 SV=1 [Tsukamurella paurometabola]|uniref:Phosphoesterase PA-phosphatase related protein n=1 Tax=Tsukamurella paurometabola (strain ATCC 8368 / DSM 20162 / CCUG 35730 / CIP 100753 / JCM 10117 / KCTC 9821 / NBRC 16120 / NCIMB 702349 / NCTC 13040) TaxID=521096 RepID=D5UQ49_TSUPD|nr:phosphatase PAP2 family protein [Tsukamurella paurometabola]ADG76817.1 phosphoesterase PA-phosphatase related protein [Tsukamurella paurometabola DSM 20162]SUP41761.1 PAP2 superfamily [Tsukamurella paurometabola]